MKYSFWIIAVFTQMLLFSCKEKKEDKVKLYSNGNVEWKYIRVNDSIETFLSYYVNGVQKDSMTLIRGRITGRQMRYHSNGNIEADCTWRNGMQEGPCSTYYESGNLKNFAYFEDSIKIGDVVQYYDIPGKRISYLGNFSNVRGKEWTNYFSRYSPDGGLIKASVRLDTIIGKDKTTPKDSLKLTLKVGNLEYPNLRVFLGDYDKKYNLLDSTDVKVFDSKSSWITVFVSPKGVGKHTARGLLTNYKLIEKTKNGVSKTEGKDIYWSYDYEVVH